MYFLHEMRTLTDPNYMMATSAQHALIEEIRGLRYDIQNSEGSVPAELTYAILRLCEHLENS